MKKFRKVKKVQEVGGAKMCLWWYKRIKSGKRGKRVAWEKEYAQTRGRKRKKTLGKKRASKVEKKPFPCHRGDPEESSHCN